MEKDIRHAQEGKPSMEEADINIDTKVKPKGKRGKKLLLIHLVALVLVGSLVGATYWWRDNTANDQIKNRDSDISAKQATITSLKKQLAAEKAKSSELSSVASQTECTEVAPSASAIESIAASITSGNTAALASYSTSSINVILAATEGIGPSTPVAMTTSVSDFISDATSPWDFSLPASVLSSYGSGGYGQYSPGTAVVGKSSDGKVISFSFDCNGKIDTVFMAASAEMM